jgi:hypothetical protein
MESVLSFKINLQDYTASKTRSSQLKKNVSGQSILLKPDENEFPKPVVTRKRIAE